MNKEQAIVEFWKRFNLPAYDELSVPDDAKTPYITYRIVTGSMGYPVALGGSIWDRSTSWKLVSEKAEEIDKYLSNGGVTIPYIDGLLWIQKAEPFSQRMVDDTDKQIKRMILNIQAEFI